MSLLLRLARTRWYPLMAAVALVAPRRFLSAYYRKTLPAPHRNASRPFAVTLSFDVDHERDVRALPPLLDLLRHADVRAGFAIVGAWAERYPEEHRALAEAGFELINHSQRHPNNPELCPDRFFDRLDTEAMREEVETAHRVLTEVCGVAPTVFRAPHFGELHTDAVYPILAGLGYRASSGRLAIRAPHGGLPAATGTGEVVEFPVSTCPDHPHAVLDSWHALERPRPWHAGPGALVRTVEALFTIAEATGAYVNLYFDPAAIVNLPDREAFLGLFASRRDQLRDYGDLVREKRYLPHA